MSKSPAIRANAKYAKANKWIQVADCMAALGLGTTSQRKRVQRRVERFTREGHAILGLPAEATLEVGLLMANPIPIED